MGGFLRIGAVLTATLILSGCPPPEPAGWQPAFDASDAGWVLNAWASSPDNIYAVGGEPTDGVIHHYDGATWQDVTPDDWGEVMVNEISVSPHDPGTAYAAVSRYKFNDFTPMAYVTHDYGQSWEGITDGFAENAWVHVVREDPRRPGLLYAGTETGL